MDISVSSRWKSLPEVCNAEACLFMADSFLATDFNRNRFGRGQRQPEHKRVRSVRFPLDTCPIIHAMRFGLAVDFHAAGDCLSFFQGALGALCEALQKALAASVGKVRGEEVDARCGFPAADVGFAFAFDGKDRSVAVRQAGLPHGMLRGAEVVVARRKVVQPPRVSGFCAWADGCGFEAFRGLHRTFEARDVVLRVKIPVSHAIPREDLVRGGQSED